MAIIVCGTDFSPHSDAAATAAAALAKRFGDTLELVYVARPHADDAAPPPEDVARVAAELATRGDKLRALGAEVCERQLWGEADELLASHASQVGARCIVVGTHGARGPRRWIVGSVAARTAQTAEVPVIVFRGSVDPWLAWAADGTPLTLMCGVDFSPGTDHALAWLKQLMAAGPCSVHLAHVLWPPAEQKRRHTELKTGEPAPAGEDAIGITSKDLAARLDGHAPPGAILEIRSNWGRTADFLADWAVEAGADLLIIGTRHLTGLARVWDGSVAQGVIAQAKGPVASVPPPPANPGSG